MPVLAFAVAFVAATIGARVYRRATGVWVPGWIGGISLLVLFAVGFVVAIALGAPAWWEAVFFAVVGVHVGAFISLSRMKLDGPWWQFWR